jgi:transcriptional regulator of acetoin/glycerol metabolism
MSGGPTGAMRQIDEVRRRHDAALVLLYAEEFRALPGAWALPERGAVVLGRDPESEIPLDVAAVSRRHASVRVERGKATLTDLGSTNGTFVEGQRVQEMELEAGMEIRIGDAFFKYVEEPAAPYLPYRLDGELRGGVKRLAERDSSLVGGLQMDRIAADLERVADTALSVMVFGESGTGKEVAATELHKKSGRRGHFSAVNCAAIPANLIESELFGYKRGAFSGAERDKPGILRTAHEGTLLLDEIGDMPLEAQAKLLRVLQTKEVLPLGASTPERVDVRVVAATHRDLDKLQRDGKFRQDLYARLNEHQVRLPPLRDRKEDVVMLSRAFAARHGAPQVELAFRYVLALLAYDWPYNVRELEACIKRSVVLADGAP